MSLLVVGFASCDNDDEYGTGEPINEESITFEIIENSPDHTVLASLLVNSGLDQALDNGTLAIFAPTDDAFSKIDIKQI